MDGPTREPKKVIQMLVELKYACRRSRKSPRLECVVCRADHVFGGSCARPGAVAALVAIAAERGSSHKLKLMRFKIRYFV